MRLKGSGCGGRRRRRGRDPDQVAAAAVEVLRHLSAVKLPLQDGLHDLQRKRFMILVVVVSDCDRTRLGLRPRLAVLLLAVAVAVLAHVDLVAVGLKFYEDRIFIFISCD